MIQPVPVFVKVDRNVVVTGAGWPCAFALFTVLSGRGHIMVAAYDVQSQERMVGNVTNHKREWWGNLTNQGGACVIDWFTRNEIYHGRYR